MLNISNTKPTYKNILILSIPIMIGMFVHYAFTFADRFFIATLGLKQAAGGAISSTLFWVIFTFTGLVSGGAIALVSRKKGENNENELKDIIEQSLFLALVVGISIAIVGYFTANQLFAFFDVEEIVAFYGKEYYQTFLFGYPMMYISITVSVIFQAVGETKIPMLIFSFMSLLNIVLDPILIYGVGDIPSFGIKGAAYASIISEIISGIWMLILFYKKFKIKLAIKPKLDMIKRILKIGTWSGLSGFSRPVSGLALQKIIAFYGTSAVAGFGFGIQWLSIAFIFAEGIRVAVSTMVGQYLGSNRLDYLKLTIKKAFILGSMALVTSILLGVIFAKEGISIFSKDPEVIKIGSSYLRIVMISLVFDIPLTVFLAVFSGAGDTKPPMIISFIANWPVKILMASITTYVLGMTIIAVWYAVALSIMVEGMGLYFWYLRGNWLKKKI